MIHPELMEWLDEGVHILNHPSFIPDDPISVPHQFSRKADIEIAGLFAALLAWGQRKTIIKNALALMERMDNAPFDFILNHGDKDLKKMEGFVHRTFNDTDLLGIISVLSDIYTQHGTLENLYISDGVNGMREALIRAGEYFYGHPDFAQRSRKHISTPLRGSACKRLNMFLRWMIRKDNGGVDFGIWDKISPAQLMIPLDVHSGRTARRLGLLQNPKDHWNAVEELTALLRTLDPKDPVKYDFVLFGTGTGQIPFPTFKFNNL